MVARGLLFSRLSAEDKYTRPKRADLFKACSSYPVLYGTHQRHLYMKPIREIPFPFFRSAAQIYQTVLLVLRGKHPSVRTHLLEAGTVSSAANGK